MYSPPHAVGRSAPGGEKRAWYSPPHAVARSARAGRRVGRRERGIRLPTQWGGRRAQRAGWGEGSVVFASPPQWGGRRAQRAGWGERSVVFASPRSGEVGARSAPGGEKGAWYSPPHAVGRSARAARRVGRRERGIRLPTQWGGRRAQRAGWGETSLGSALVQSIDEPPQPPEVAAIEVKPQPR